MSTAQPTDDAIFRHEITVPETAIDPNRHVNNVVFVQWMQDVAIKHFESVVSLKTLKEANLGWVVRTHNVEYLSPAFVGEEIRISTWIVNFSRVRSLRRYRFNRVSDGKLLVRGETDWVMVNRTTGRPASIPDEVRDAFKLHNDSDHPSVN